MKTLQLSQLPITCLFLLNSVRSQSAPTSSQEPGNSSNNNNDVNKYGVDVSYPIHRSQTFTNYAWLSHNNNNNKNNVNSDPMTNNNNNNNNHHHHPMTPSEFDGIPIQALGDKQQFYEELMQGCRDYYEDDGHLCDEIEEDRLKMSERQPQSMRNYTTTGFRKIRTPPKLFSLIQNFWHQNYYHEELESWPTGYTYTNHWSSPTFVTRVEDTSLPGGGPDLKDAIWNQARPILEEWTGVELVPTSLYGIRVYTEGSVLAPHVDRLPLVISAIVNVDQDVDEDWPLEVYGRDGMAVNVTTRPGDMILYESHSLIHGRPFPLKGRWFANLFLHFQPTGRLLNGTCQNNNNNNNENNAKDVGICDMLDIESAGQYSSPTIINSGNSSSDVNDDVIELPPYLIEGSPEVENYLKMYPYGWDRPQSPKPSNPTPSITEAVISGNIPLLTQLSLTPQYNSSIFHQKDRNGWQPLHEAIRAGHTNVVELLVERHGVNVNERTNFGSGYSPLTLARLFWGEDHDVARYLERIGGVVSHSDSGVRLDSR